MDRDDENIKNLGFKTSSKLLIRSFKLIKKQWKYLVGFLVFIIITSSLEAIGTYILKDLIDQGIVAKNVQAIIINLIKYGSAISLISVTVFGFIYCAGMLGERLQYELRKKLFNHLQELSFSFFDRTNVGWIMSRVTADTTRIADMVTWMMLDLVWGITNISVSIVFMFIINWQLTLFVIVILPLLILIAIKFRQRIITQYRRVRTINSKITSAYNENISGVRIVKSCVREKKNLRNFGKLTNKMFDASYRAAWLSAMFLPTVQLLTALALGAVIWYGGWQVQMGGLTIGGIKAFLGYITFMLWPIQDLARVYSEMQHSIAGAEKVFSLIDTKPEVTDVKCCISLAKMQGQIEFDRVSFYYDEKNPVLTDFNLKVAAGETIALVGPTGGGKSTIVNLACRFYEPQKGKILIDGMDYKKIALSSIYSRLGIILQSPHLFSGTIKENIRYGRLNARDEDIYEAAKVANADAFIRTLEKGYEEEVGEAGVLLSVGQKQLICLARAILSKPDIFVMDEATSSIDTITEDLIQKGMQQVMKKCTSFIIAHRLSTIRNADRIIVIHNGRIIEMGNHKQLISRKGYYYNLYTRQFRSERAKELKAIL
jgi:ATP-binding cassette subfamily B protein